MKTFSFTNISPLVLKHKDFMTILGAENASIKEGSLIENADKTVSFAVVVSDDNDSDFHEIIKDWDTHCCQSQRV